MEHRHGGSPITKDEFVEQVRVNLNRMLQHNPRIRMEEVAGNTGYAVNSLRMFRNGRNPSAPVAMKLITKYRELGEGLVCPCCGGLPPMPWR